MKSNSLTLDQALQFLGSIQPNGTEEKSLPAVKGRRLKAVTRYYSGISTDLTSNGNSTILPSTQKKTGITNFPKGNLMPTDTNFLVTAVRILFDIVTPTDPLVCVWAGIAPVAFKNGEIRIGVENQPLVFESPITDVTNFKASTGNDDDFREVCPFLLLANKTFDIQLLTAGTPVASAFKIELRGYELIKS